MDRSARACIRGTEPFIPPLEHICGIVFEGRPWEKSILLPFLPSFLTIPVLLLKKVSVVMFGLRNIGYKSYMLHFKFFFFLHYFFIFHSFSLYRKLHNSTSSYQYYLGARNNFFNCHGGNFHLCFWQVLLVR